MAKPNYSAEKRRKEMARKSKKEAKGQSKGKTDEPAGESAPNADQVKAE